jgi:hypothetical protein
MRRGDAAAVSDSDSVTYKQRAVDWRGRAAELPDGGDRLSCLTIAEAYADLADLIEAQGRNRGPGARRAPPSLWVMMRPGGT